MSFHYNNNNLPYILYHKLFQVFMNPKTTHTEYSLSISCGIRLFHLVLDVDFTIFATYIIQYYYVGPTFKPFEFEIKHFYDAASILLASENKYIVTSNVS